MMHRRLGWCVINASIIVCGIEGGFYKVGVKTLALCDGSMLMMEHVFIHCITPSCIFFTFVYLPE